MELVDENKNNMPEGEYLEMCNAMKVLYTTKPVKAYVPRRQNGVRRGSFTTVPAPEISAEERERSRQVEIERCNETIRKFERKLATGYKLKVKTVKRKIEAWKKEYPIYYYMNVTSSRVERTDKDAVKFMEEAMIAEEITTKERIEKLYQDYVDELDNAERERLRGFIASNQETLRRLGHQ